MINGENAPFRDNNENKANKGVAGDNRGTDRDDGEQKVEQDMQKRTESVAAFANKNVVSHGLIIA